MQFVDLKTQYKRIENTLQHRIQTIFDHGKYIMGPEIKEFEDKLTSYTGAKYCLTCSSGTDALLLALMAYNVGPGDAIFTTPFTFIATGEVISLLGATPIFVDIDPKTLNLDSEKLRIEIEKVKNGKTIAPGIPQDLNIKGIIPVDLFGLPADYDSINKIAQEHSLFVLEDAAQSFGSLYKGKIACNLTDIAATSFFPAKPLGCYGDGGAVFTNNREIFTILESLRVHGKGSDKYDNIRIGINGRLDTLQAGILLAKMDVFSEEIELRQRIAMRYAENLERVVLTPSIPEGYKSAWAQYSILSDQKEEIIEKMKDKNIPSAIYYPKPLHLQTAFSYLGYNEGSMPVSESTSKRIFSIPMHPYLTINDQDTIISAIKQ